MTTPREKALEALSRAKDVASNDFTNTSAIIQNIDEAIFNLQLSTPSAPSSRGEVEEAVKAAIREAYANGVQEGEAGESEKSVNEIIAALAKLGAR